MQAVYRIIDSAATSNATIFVTGESGTGKEVCANAIHQRSPRKTKPFIALNCGAIPKDLMESEIFGHVKGAFTGAVTNRDGAATQANKGTLFLDEICEMDLDLQTKLLRFIQTGSFQTVGGSQLETVDVRFICATNRDPWQEVQEGRFREDLYYRLHVIPIHLPPLRDRETDVKLLIDRLLLEYSKEENKEFEKFSSSAIRIMMDYSWPGNVRELQNIIRNIVVLNTGSEVTPDMIPKAVSGNATHIQSEKTEMLSDGSPPLINQSNTEVTPLWQVEKETIEKVWHQDCSIHNTDHLLMDSFIEVLMITINRKELLTALPLTILLLITLLIISAYIQDQKNSTEAYNQNNNFIKVLSASAFRRDEG